MRGRRGAGSLRADGRAQLLKEENYKFLVLMKEDLQTVHNLGESMKTKFIASIALLLVWSTLSFADFKYSETSKITGGAMMNMAKMAGVFSKDARQMNAPTTRTISVKGSKLREEESDGSVRITDLAGRRFISIDPKSQTYSVVTFDDFKKAMERKQQEMQEKMKGKHGQDANMKITPKFESTETGASKTLLGVEVKELEAKIEMLMESSDPKAQGQQISTVINTDQWIAPNMAGYKEIRDFHLKMAKEMDWMPGQAMNAMANSNLQISMNELRKSNLAHISGMPLLTYTSMTLGGNGAPPASAQNQPQQQQQAEDNSVPTSASGAVMKGLGGMFKKKKQQDADNSAASTPNPASTPGSMMDMQTEVTSYSNSPLDPGLFEPPTGYSEKKITADDMAGGKR